MKRKVFVALLLGMCVTMAGCGKEAKETTTETVTEAATEGTTEASSEAETEAVKAVEPEYTALDYVELGQYKGLEITLAPVDEVTEEDIAQQIYDDCSMYDKLEQITEGTVADGDVVNIDYVGKQDGVEFDGGTDKGADLTIGSGQFIPGFEDGLIGVSIGDTVDVEATFPENYSNAPELAGQTVTFTVTVNHVKQAPEITDEIVAEISDYETAEEYLASVEENLKANLEAIRENEKLTEIMDLIFSGAVINGYPEEVVAFRLNQIKDVYKLMAEQSEMEFADFLEQQMEATEEEFDSVYTTYIQQSMIQELLLKAVAEAEEMEVTEEEYEAGVEEYIASTGSESRETFFENYSENDVRTSVLLNKALDFLKENTIVNEESEETATEAVSEETTEEVTEAETTEAATEEETTEAATEERTEA